MRPSPSGEMKIISQLKRDSNERPCRERVAAAGYDTNRKILRLRSIGGTIYDYAIRTKLE
jgi:hypothetical protein